MGSREEGEGEGGKGGGEEEEAAAPNTTPDYSTSLPPLRKLAPQSP